LTRVAIGAVFATTLFTVPHVVDPTPVAAGGSCTGWTSRTTPPKRIRVLRTASGRVETVNFRTYVAEVMASGEWPSALRRATLEAGAVFTKQYAWYHSLKGKHRPGYSKGGRCYDITDTVRDQIFRPERAEPTAKQWAAIDKTWGLSLRKKDRFLLTGYRRGTSTTCGADANGWKLFARSAQDCAKRGLNYKQILRKYLNPGLDFVWSPDVGPAVKRPSFMLKAGTDWERGIATVAWSPLSAGSTIARYRLQRKVSGGKWKNVPLASDTTRKTRAWVKAGKRNRFRVRAVNSSGTGGPWSYSKKRKAALRGPVGTSLSSSGTAAAPAKLRASFGGRSVAVMASLGPRMGKARVFINGQRRATIDLRRSERTDRVVIWARNYGSAQKRTITLKAVEPGRPVDFGGFFFLN
jgi:hypothetical protein